MKSKVFNLDGLTKEQARRKMIDGGLSENDEDYMFTLFSWEGKPNEETCCRCSAGVGV